MPYQLLDSLKSKIFSPERNKKTPVPNRTGVFKQQLFYLSFNSEIISFFLQLAGNITQI